MRKTAIAILFTSVACTAGCGESFRTLPCEPNCSAPPIELPPAVLPGVTHGTPFVVQQVRFAEPSVTRDLSGDGVTDNQLALLFNVVAQLGVSRERLEAYLNRALVNAAAGQLLEMRVADGPDVARLTLRNALVWRTARENVYQADPNTISDTLTTAYDGGRFAVGPGKLVWTVPTVASSTPARLRLQKVQIDAERVDDQLIGTLTGAISKESLFAELLPLLATAITQQISDGALTDSERLVVRVLLDADDDGEIEDDETHYGPFAQLLRQTLDIDSDDDGTNDALSFALDFTAIRCELDTLHTGSRFEPAR
ncbi:MAG: hypothetical protein H6707_10160 [Deltaproteobacteria bacterium]|nr:hypothetical protein [Deltaproteobacteria bacterium]